MPLTCTNFFQGQHIYTKFVNNITIFYKTKIQICLQISIIKSIKGKKYMGWEEFKVTITLDFIYQRLSKKHKIYIFLKYPNILL